MYEKAQGASNRTRLTHPDSTYIPYGYDQLHRMTPVRNSGGTAPCLHRTAFGRNQEAEKRRWQKGRWEEPKEVSLSGFIFFSPIFLSLIGGPGVSPYFRLWRRGSAMSRGRVGGRRIGWGRGRAGPHLIFATEQRPPEWRRHQRCSIESGEYLWKKVSIFGKM